MEPAVRRTPHTRRDWIAAAVLAFVAFVAFWPALDCGFVNLDDPDYVTRNKSVTDGLTGAGFRYAFTASGVGNWHPLTWLSLQLDATFSKMDPFGYHLTSVLLHAANAALLFLALRSLTGAFWRSGAVALLFAVHPLRVESVAWIAERKDVLSVFFGLLALWAYADYVRRPSAWRYAAVAAAFAASLMSKPMLVTLPFLLLVLDWWPLGRVHALRDWRRPVLEKLPLLAVVIAASVLTYLTQTAGGAVMDLQTFPLSVRVENAGVSYVMYLIKTVCPLGLGIYYPHPAYPWGGGLPVWKVAAAAVLLVTATAVAAALRRRAPYLLAGWLWYLGTLVPVIGLVQAGDQAYADRYSYFPQIGVLVACCWGAAELARRREQTAAAVAVAAAVVLAVITRVQLQTWHDSIVLWKHDLAVAAPSPLAYLNLGVALGEEGTAESIAEGENYLRKAIELNPKAVLPRINLGSLLLRQGKLEAAADEFKAACDLRPDYAQPHTQLGDVLLRLGRVDEAAELHDKATRLAPGLSGAWCNLGIAEVSRNEYKHAEECLRKALELQPDFPEAHCALGQLLLAQRGATDGEGLEHLRAAVRFNPDYEEGHLFLGIALAKLNDASCVGHLERAVRYYPDVAEAWFQLGIARGKQRQWEQAVECLEQAVKLDPNKKDRREALRQAREILGAGRPALPPTGAEQQRHGNAGRPGAVP
jgi:tetratricopeptide (TPR) repeat protein